MREQVLSGLAPLLLCVIAAGCTHPKPPTTIGLSMRVGDAKFYQDLLDGIKKQADFYHYKVLLAEPTDEAAQQDEVEWFVNKGVKAIVIVPVDSNVVGSAVREANTADIPVFTADIDSTSTDARVTGYVASNNARGGATAAQLMCRAIGSPGKLAIIDQPAVSSVRDRVAAFKSALRTLRQCRDKEAHVVEDVDVGIRHVNAYKATKQLRQLHPDLAGIFFTNDASLLAAIPKPDRAFCRKPVLVSYDAIKQVRDDIDDGVVYGDAKQEPTKIGNNTINAIHDFLNTKHVPSSLLSVNVRPYGPYGCVGRRPPRS